MRTFAVVTLVACLTLVAGCKTAPKGPEPLPVSVQDIPGRTVLARAFTGSYMDFTKSFETFMKYVSDLKIVPQGDMYAVWFDDPEKVPPEKQRYEIRIPVAPGTGATAPYVVKGVPPMKTAGVILVGPYDRITTRFHELFDWVGKHGYQPAGPLMEVYLVHPGSGVPPDKYETEVHVPIRPAAVPMAPMQK